MTVLPSNVENETVALPEVFPAASCAIIEAAYNVNGDKPVTANVVLGVVPTTAPSIRTEYKDTPTLSVEAVQVSVAPPDVTLLATRFVGVLGSSRSGGPA